MQYVPFDDTTLTKLSDLIEEAESKPTIESGYNQREIWFRWDEFGELRITTCFDRYVNISRVNLLNKRKGTMSRINAVLEEFCKTNSIQRIMVDAVETPAMASWCVKHGYIPMLSTGFEADGYFIGSYSKYLLV